jgi:hypothetical protein
LKESKKCEEKKIKLSLKINKKSRIRKKTKKRELYVGEILKV